VSPAHHWLHEPRKKGGGHACNPRVRVRWQEERKRRVDVDVVEKMAAEYHHLIARLRMVKLDCVHAAVCGAGRALVKTLQRR
jgi:hypothetical protein